MAVVRDQPGTAAPNRALQARARADLVRRTTGNALPALPESAAQIRQRARALRAQDATGRVTKTFGTTEPASFATGEIASQMTPASPFSPGEPVGPYDGFSRTPRTHDFVTGYNIATRPRTHERVAFGTLRGLIEAYDIAQIAIWHRIDSLRALEWSLVAADGHEGDVSGAVALGMAALKKPDRKTPYGAWLAKWVYDILAYDAGSLWRMRNRAGQVVGLKPVDGTTLAPLLDYWGDPPEPGAPAFVQYSNGLPWNWLTTDDLIYQPFRPRTNSIYGTAPLESVLLNANTDLRFQSYFLQRFCYDEQTEILTRDGWKRLPDVQGDEQFATRSAAGEFEWQASKDGKLHVFDSGGTMVQFKNRDVDLLVTPNHRMLTRRKRQGKGLLKTQRDWEYDWHIRRADSFLGRCSVDWRLPLTSSWAAPEAVPERFTLSVPTASPVGRSATTKVDMPMWAFARFLGLFIAEGHLRHTPETGGVDRWEINVSQMSGGRLEEAKRILKDTGLNWSYWSDEDTGRFTVGCKALWTYLEQCGRGASNKVLPAGVMDWPAELLKELIYGLMIGDGTFNPSGLPTYITTSRRLADQVQEIWQKCGIYSSVAAKQPHPTAYGKRMVYLVRARREAEFQMPTAQSVPYEGNVYCVSVPNGIVLVRRNGKTMWCGNTDGNLPAAFASAPETWTPQQIEQFQEYWDGFILGDQAFKNQIRWIPPGSKIEWSNEKEFTDAFSLFMMRKTLSAYHVVPSDVGITDTVNKSTGETQSDVQHRVGDVPLAKHVSSVITAYLQDDLHLPIKHQHDFGEEQDDRLQTAQADDVYVKMGAISSSDIRELRYGLTEPEGKRVPRFIFSNRGGPIPISSLEAVAGPIDPESGAPMPGAPLPEKVFQPVEGVEAQPPTPRPPLAVQMFGPDALPDQAPQDVPVRPDRPERPAPAPVTKDGPTAGITAATGIASYDLIGQHDDEDETAKPKPVITKGSERRAAELAAFRSFVKGRKRDGKWRDFGFTAIDPIKAHRLNDSGRLAVRKSAGQVAVAGLAVLAADTGRVLMLQRALDDEDPASGTWEMPGGHLEGDETPLQGAAREWAEETGCTPPPGIQIASWLSPDGIYQGIVWLIGHEADVPVFDGRDQVTNPDDPDGDQIEAIAWWLPTQLPDNPAVRPELLDSIDAVMDALTTVTVNKAAGGGSSGPKADASAKEASAAWPGWDHDEAVAGHWAKKLTDGYVAALSHAHAERIAAAFIAAHPRPKSDKKPTKVETAALAAARLAAALAHIEGQGLDLTSAATVSLQGLYADAYLIGAASGNAVIDGGKPTLASWKPGDTQQANRLVEGLTLGAGLSALLLRAPETAAAMSNTRMAALASALAAGAAAGQSAAIIAGSLIAVLKAGWRSLTAALTGATTASSAGADDVYRKREVALVRWALDPTSKSCPRCVDNANASPRPLGQAWPSGSTSTPEHNRCRCQLVPA